MATAATAINTPGDKLGDPLDITDFIRPGFALNLTTMPAWPSGKAEPVPLGKQPPALTDTAFVPMAGDVHASASPGVPAYVKPGQRYPAFSWLSDELAVYPNGDAIAESGYSPFSLNNGVLTITAAPTPKEVVPFLPAGFPDAYTSGAFCSFPFAQTYGFFAMRAQFPKGAGLWPAFWLMPVDLSWPPELDVVEALMQKPGVVYTTAHDASYKTVTSPPSSQMAFATNTADLSLEPHEFGVDWGPTKLRWYLDRKLIFSLPTPLDYNRPMYWIVNLAVGGPKSWAGAPDSTTVFPAHMQVFAVEAWQRKAYLP